MRILLDARYLDNSYSGIATYSRGLIEGLARVDQENHYQVVVRSGFKGSMRVGPNFELLSYRPKPLSFSSYFRFHDFIEDLEPDVFHSLWPGAPVFYDGPIIVTAHDLQPFTDPHFSAGRPGPLRHAYEAFYRWAYPNTFARSKWVLCVSYSTRDEIADLMPGAVPKLIVARSGVLREELAPAAEEEVAAALTTFELRRPYLLYYGSTRPNKNLVNLVKAFAQLVQRGHRPGLRLVLVVRRDRFFKDVLKVAKQTGVLKALRILDPVDRATQRALLTGAEALAFPTKHEGFGFPPLEAMAAGVPVVAGRSGALPEILGDAALFVDPDSPASIAEGLERVLDDIRLRERLIKRGQTQIATFDWDRTAAQVRDIYRLLI